ncbi:DMT family transporter [Paenibacillus dendritiformis]|uniref:DMT family transporter n=1 Tax=Paenibacillus dendritiformis TaxID=130049 RepID=UPI003652C5D9
MKQHLIKAYAAALIYACIIGFSFLFVTIALESADPLDVLAHRFTIAFAAATLILAVKRPSFSIRWSDLLKIMPLALLYPTGFFVFQTFGLVYTTSSEAGMIQATVPIMTVFLASFLLRERSNAMQKIALIVSSAGVIFMLLMGGMSGASFSLIGITLILLSALCAALYNIFARSLTKAYSLPLLTYVMTGFGFIAFNVLSIGSHLAEGTLSSWLAPMAEPRYLLSILYLGILSSLVTSFMSNYALSVLEAAKMSVFSHVATLITIFAGVLFLHESLEYYHVLGGIAILGGVIVTNLPAARRAKEHASRSAL